MKTNLKKTPQKKEHTNNASHTRDRISLLILKIDQQIELFLNTIIHHPKFQQLEASWRGISQLIRQSNHQSYVKIKLLDLSFQELSKDLIKAPEFDQSILFKKVYTEEFDRPGGEPFGLLIGDYYFSHQMQSSIDSIGILQEIAKVAAASFAPFISSVDSSLFGIDHFNKLQAPITLSKIFAQKEYRRFHQLKQENDSRFVGLVLPKILIRKPYHDHRNFHETLSSLDDYLWGNPAYLYAFNVIASFTESGWFARIHHQVLFSNQPCPNSLFTKQRTQIRITDTQEKQLNDLGLIALCESKHTHLPIFYNSPSLVHHSAQSNHSARLSSQIHYLLCASRFAHYLKVMMRNKVGSFTELHEYEQYLQKWLLQYCAASTDAASHIKAKYPLREGRIKLKPVPGHPGKFNCLMHLSPHYQLEEIQSQIKLITQLKIT